MPKHMDVRVVLKENLCKNVFVISIGLLVYVPVMRGLSSVSPVAMNDFLLTLSMLIVTVCFANFACSYQHFDLKKRSIRLLSHLATFVFMLLLFILLEALVVSFRLVYPGMMMLVLIFSVLLYLGVSLYDFWDLLRYFGENI